MFQRRRRSKRRSSSPVSYAAVDSIEIDASADVVWEILLNVQAYDRLFAQTKNIPLEAVGDKKSLNPIEPGTKFVEQRTLPGGRDVCFEIAVTVVEADDATRRIFALATTVWQCTGTSTHTLQDLMPNTTCRLEITYGMVPNGFCGKCYMFMFRKRIKRDASLSLLSDLSDIKAAAEQVGK